MNMEKYQEKSPKYGLTFCFFSSKCIGKQKHFSPQCVQIAVCYWEVTISRLTVESLDVKRVSVFTDIFNLSNFTNKFMRWMWRVWQLHFKSLFHHKCNAVCFLWPSGEERLLGAGFYFIFCTLSQRIPFILNFVNVRVLSHWRDVIVFCIWFVFYKTTFCFVTLNAVLTHMSDLGLKKALLSLWILPVVLLLTENCVSLLPSSYTNAQTTALIFFNLFLTGFRCLFVCFCYNSAQHCPLLYAVFSGA